MIIWFATFPFLSVCIVTEGRTANISSDSCYLLTTTVLKIDPVGCMCRLCSISSRLNVSVLLPMSCKYKHSGLGQVIPRMKYEQYFVVPKVALIRLPSRMNSLVAWIHVLASFSFSKVK